MFSKSFCRMNLQLRWIFSILLVSVIIIYTLLQVIQSPSVSKYLKAVKTTFDFTRREFKSRGTSTHLVPTTTHSIMAPVLKTVPLYGKTPNVTLKTIRTTFNYTTKERSFAGTIAVLIPTTTRSIKNPSLKTLTLTKICISTIKATAESKYNYKLYIGTEGYDYIATQFDALRALSVDNVQIIPMVVEGGTENKVINAIALQAYKDGVDYISRINDDTKFVTNNWTSLGIETLRNYKPTNLGVVGPTCNQGNTHIMTHDMVHRTHMDIFKYYYPPVFENWYLDDWITLVYKPDRSTKLTKWEVVHTMEQGTRYKVDQSKSKLTRLLVILGGVAIDAFIKKTSSHQTLRIISYSLFGSEPRVTKGAIENAKLASQIYPGWIVRVYHDNTVPGQVLDKLRHDNVQLIDVTTDPPFEPKAIWNLFVAFDPSVDRYVIRNIDSRLTWRERAAVDQWIESGKHFHIMRDHPFHSKNYVPSGLWGGTHDAVPDIIILIHKYYTNISQYGTLQNFLNNEIWKLANTSALQHDSFTCENYPGSVPFPTQRKLWEYVGNIYNGENLRKEEFDTLKNTTQPVKCT